MIHLQRIPLLVAALLGLQGCGGWKVRAYDDVRWMNLSEFELGAGLIETLWFNQETKWSSEDAPIARDILERGKNPGLGVRSLHERGIVGAGVNVAIIDQHICLDHPEFAGKIAAYHDTGCNQPADKSSMHGPAVASLLVGETIGVAPGARVYYAAAPTWTRDSQYQADALLWIIEQNETLSENEKIRVVSISASPSGSGSPFVKNQGAWDDAVYLAESQDILVLDCTNHHGFIGPAYYDLYDPDNLAAVTVGFPGSPPLKHPTAEGLFVPNGRRSQAEEYWQWVFGYQYTGRGGLSWSIPYAAGVMALGWQVRPELTGAQMKQLLFDTAYIKYGMRVTNPVGLIEALDSDER